MGCGSSNQHVYEPEQGGYKGPVFISLKHAVLVRDVSFLGTMNPYVKLFMDTDQEFRSTTEEGAGKFPKWQGAQTTFKKKVGKEDVIMGQVWSENTITSDVLIGEGAFSLTPVRNTNAPKEIVFSLYEKGQLAGNVTVEVTFSLDPSGSKLPEIACPDTNGKLIVEPKEAKLTRDVNLITKMDPLITIRFGNESMSTAVDMSGHLAPKWTDALEFTREVIEDTLYIEVWSFSDFGSNDLIGTGYLSITDSLSLKEKIAKKVPLFFENDPVGEVTIVYTFKTSEPNKYFPQGQGNTGPQIPQEVKHLPQQLVDFSSQMGQRLGQVFGQGGGQQQSGPANFTYFNGDQYVGDFSNNQRNGNGRLTFSHGGFYEGNFMNDVFHGRGVLQVGDTRYEGDFMNGKKNGFGRQSWQNGQAFEGQWVDNNMHGNGEWTQPDGQKKKGVWANGNRTRWDDDQMNQLQGGRTLPQGATINSNNMAFTATLSYNGQLFVYHNASQTPVFQASQFNRLVRPPFWMRLEPHGELILLDTTGAPYWTSGRGAPNFAPPFSLALQDDGKLTIQDGNRQVKWVSH